MAARIPARPVIAAKPAPVPQRQAVAPKPAPASKPAPAPKPAPPQAPALPKRKAITTGAIFAGKGLSIAPAIAYKAQTDAIAKRQNGILQRQLDEANKKIKELTPAPAGDIPVFNYPTITTESPQQLNTNTATSSTAEIDKLMGIIDSIQANPAPTDAGVNDALTIAQNTKVSGGATGFSRKQSKARQAGMVGKGTNRLSIRRQGPTLGSSGLNIGY